MYVLGALVVFIAGYWLRGKWNDCDSSPNKQDSDKNYYRKRLVAIESGGQFPIEYYYMTRYDMDTLKRLEKANGCLDSNRDMFNNKVKPILDKSKRVQTVVTILGYK